MINLGSIDLIPGTKDIINIPVGKLPSGNRLNIQAHAFAGQEPGPVVMVVAGVHGDEINSVEILRQCLEERIFEDIKIGAVLAIPIVNVYGFINFSRDVPDGKDVNRSFPGSKNGSLASRVAYVISKRVMPYATHGIDLHTGGASRFNYPQVRAYKNSPASLEMAAWFSPPVVLEKGLIAKSLRKEAHVKKLPLIVFEGGEATRFDGHSIQMGKDGIRRVLHRLGMLSEAPTAEQPLYFRKTAWLRAGESGIFMWSKSSGDAVRKGEELGHIMDPNNQAKMAVKSRKDGFIIGHNNAAVVHKGDALFHIAYE